jgi:hypothetical protein
MFLSQNNNPIAAKETTAYLMVSDIRLLVDTSFIYATHTSNRYINIQHTDVTHTSHTYTSHTYTSHTRHTTLKILFVLNRKLYTIII